MFTGKQMLVQNGLCEILEDRRLMSVSLVSGVLTVKGTTDADSVVLSLKSGDLTKLEVNVNSVTSDFDLSSITKVVVYGGDGNDMVKVDNVFGVVPFGVIEKGGDGNDLLIGGNRVDDLLGGLGDDELRGMSGNDFLDGGDGLDKLLGYAGNDVMLGGLANDLLEGGSGNDILKGSFGDDLLKGGAGLDSL
jgi:Ca2+-binding RTX toxin-like protein